MGGTTRATRGRQQLQQTAVSSPQAQASSGTTVFDEHMNVILDNGPGYVTPQDTDADSPRTKHTQYPLGSQSLSIRQSSSGPQNSSVALGHESGHLGIHVKEVISVFSRLEALGLQQQQSIQLPRCVVLGEQSSGKSSVIEAISGVRTPRSGGTCTRCPLFINLESSSDQHAAWRARVTLRVNYTFTGLSRGAKYPGWSLAREASDIPFATCGSPDELEKIIRRAQSALVHPLEDPKIFALGRDSPDQEQTHTVDFSPNIVCIYIEHPSLPDLSFYDLPGLISQSDNPSDVDLVKKLVQDYVQDPEALVLVACSLASDIATSIASGCARNEWKAGDRCIGVLTKPDLLPVGSSDEPLKKVLSNAAHKFRHGYFVVKNPDQVMLDNGKTHEDARLDEQNFFATKKPWCTSLRIYQGRFGTTNLQRFLSEKLASQMVKALPDIYARVQSRLSEVEAQLKLIPEPPTHGATRIILDLLVAFSEEVQKEMEGAYPCKEWRNFWKDLQKQFSEGLDAMRPTMMRRGQQDYGLYKSSLAGKSSDDPVCLSDGDDEDPVDIALPETPQSKRKLEDTPSPSSHKKSRMSVPPISTPSRMKPVHNVDYNDKRTVFQLDDVSKHLDLNSQSKIPGQLEPKVIDDLIKKTIAHWKVPTDKLFNELESGLRGFMRLIFDKFFQTRKDTKLYVDAWVIVENILRTSMLEQRTMAGDVYIDEWEGPYTYHKGIYNNEKKSMREKYRNARFETRLKIYMEEMAEQVGADKVTPKDRLTKNESLCSRLREEPYDVEIDVVAQVTSYYVLAVRRFHDSICMRIESKFFKRLRTKLREDMDETLGIHDEDGTRKAMELLAEPSHHATRRKELLTMKSKLLEGLHHLNALQAKHGNDISASQGSNSYPAPSFNSSSFGPTSTPLTDEMQDITQSGRVRR